MNKKLFFGAMAAAAMLLTTACSNEEPAAASGSEANVNFSIALEKGMGTRAISDGLQAKKLVYAIYDANGALIQTLDGSTNGQFVNESAFPGGLTDNVTVTLAKGQTYTAVFWAQNAACTAYNTADLENITVSYTGDNNDETRDAFFAAQTFTVTGDAEFSVTLKRPFAQINVGVEQDDWNAAVAAKFEVEKSSVTVKNAATAINLITGKTSGTAEVTYDLAAIPGEELYADADGDGVKEAYKWLSMSYILVADESEDGASKTTLESLGYTFAPKEGTSINFGEGLTTVPVQRNWRTNILGRILSSDIKFNIVIDPAFDGEYNNGEPVGVKANGNLYRTIGEAVNDGATEIQLAAGLYKMPEVHNKTLKITGVSQDAKIDLSNATYINGTSVEFTNVTIVKENENYVGFMHAGALTYTDCVFENEYWAYGTSETFKNCVFNQTSAGNYNVWIYGAKTATFENCVFNSAGKAVLVYKENGTEWYNAIFTGCEFNASSPVDGKAAIEIDSSLNPYNVTITNCTANGFANGSISGNTLYNLKKGTLGVNCTITVDGQAVE